MQTSAKIVLAHADLRSGLAIGRSLQRHGIPFLAAVANPRHFACYSRAFRSNTIEVSDPRQAPDAFVEQIAAAAKDCDAVGVVPISDAAMGALNSARDRLPASTRFFGPSSQAIDAVLDKDKNIRIAEQQGIPVPRTIEVRSADELPDAAAKLGYPVVLKRLSQQEFIPAELSDFTAEIIENEEQLRPIAARLAEFDVVPQIQKFVRGEMHNICCFAVRGEIVAAHEYTSFRRAKHVGVARRFVETNPTRLGYTRKLLRAISWEGVAGVSFLVSPDSSDCWYLETNGRFWASVQGSINAGWDFPYWAARYFLHGESPTPPDTWQGRGITCYHTEDLSLLVNYLGGGPSPVSTSEYNAMKAIWAYLRAFGPGYQSDVFRWSDPMPAIVDHVQLVARGIRKLRGKTATVSR